MLTVGGLFSGIGGWELGLERAGMRVVWHCESDPFCQRVLEHHWPGVPVYPDVRRLTERGASRYNIAPVDVLCGGFPCQDISSAGAGAGIDGERSGLWSEYARLVGELRPRYVLVENVAALLARGLGRVLSDLSAIGYDAEWDCIPASAVGAPHRRDRVWVVAYPAGDDGGSRGSGGSASGGAWEPEPVGALQVADSQREGLQGCGSECGLRQGGGEVETGGCGASSGAGIVADPQGERQQTRPGTSGTLGAGELAAIELEGRAALPAGGGRRADPWLVEPDVGRVAHGIPARPHGPQWATPKATDAERGGRGDLIQQVRGNASPSGHFKSSDQQEGTAGASDDGSLRAMRSDGGTDEASPRLFGAGAGPDPLLRVPREGGSGTRPTSNEEAEALRDLRRDVHELQPLTGEDLLAAMSVRGWSPELIEALGGWWAIEPPVGRVAVGVPQRVDRLRSLGNALVPQIAEWIGRRVLAYEATCNE